jgi:hypothetical protein
VVLIDPEDLAKSLHDMLCKEALEQMGENRNMDKDRFGARHLKL